MYPRNAASPERIAIGPVVQISDGAVQTSGCTVRLLESGGAEGDGGGTTAYSTDGVVLYTPLQAETDQASFVLIAKKTGCIPACVTIVTSASATAGKVVLSGETHTSAVIPTVTDMTNARGKYANGAVWVGPAANTNTASYVDGIITNPVSTIAAAKTIADALGLRRFYTVRTGATQIGAAMVGYDFDGSAWTCTTTGGSRDVGTSSFNKATVTGGTFAGTSGSIWWDECEFSTGVSVGISNMSHCTFAGTLTLIEAGSYDFIDCASIVAGTNAPEFAVPAGTVNISFRRWSGGIKISGITSGTTVSIDMISGGTVTLTGADGNVQVRGMGATIDDQRTGTPTLGQTAFLNRTVLATPTNITAGTITTVSGNVNGSVASVTGAVGSVTGLTAADVGAIKTKTDSLTFTSAGFVDANVQKINDVTITGDGQTGTEFGV